MRNADSFHLAAGFSDSEGEEIVVAVACGCSYDHRALEIVECIAECPRKRCIDFMMILGVLVPGFLLVFLLLLLLTDVQVQLIGLSQQVTSMAINSRIPLSLIQFQVVSLPHTSSSISNFPFEPQQFRWIHPHPLLFFFLSPQTVQDIPPSFLTYFHPSITPNIHKILSIHAHGLGYKRFEMEDGLASKLHAMLIFSSMSNNLAFEVIIDAAHYFECKVLDDD